METSRNNIIVLLSTHDSILNDKTPRKSVNKNTLENIAKNINGSTQIKPIIIHEWFFLSPYTRLNNAEVVESEDGQFYLIAQKELSNKQERITLEDGTVLIKEYFEKKDFSPTTSELETVLKDKITINEISASVIGPLSESEKLNILLLIHSEVFSDSGTIITIGKYIVAYLGLKTLLPKIHEKMLDSVSEIWTDIFKKHVKEAAANFIKNFNHSTSPKAFIFSISDDIKIELFIKYENLDDAVSALDKEKILLIKSKIETLKKTLKPAKIQFLYTKENKWELNYILTHLGEVIGTEKSCDLRNIVYRELNNEFLNT
ncbi:hypothetical protein VB264_05260 [Arcicella aquatica]|uniref:Uncharacterized protein n=1 Tax=Arcicella aquatica TaxID=217141 RepID=A0ABU5QK74_9BACT|nr:hypothetical protein [Arcicella aquatica]MEA5257185.1 hypothetical protein [Arcicella aquatica]